MNIKKRNRLAGKGKNKRPKSHKSNGRDYSYDKAYESTAEQKRNRAKRNAARRRKIKSGSAKVGDGKDVDHIKPLKRGGSNSRSNTRVIKRSTNRAKK